MSTQNQETVNLKCRNPQKACPSITAIEIKHPTSGVRLYQCTKCKFTWPISVGGSLNIHGL